ncbi:MAG: hypothetical protein LBP99_05030, partial [Azoarcus sp.]|nr:hypothetical protein [Azoarcus sp.]
MKEKIPLDNHSHYTLRALRPGYVYVYNPEDNRQPWRGFITTPRGELYAFPQPIGKDGPEKIMLNEVPDACTPGDEKGAMARCITIPKAEKAQNVWICYSEVEWTKAVWERFNKNEKLDPSDKLGCRDAVMTKINIANWLTSLSADSAELAKTGLLKLTEVDWAEQLRNSGDSSLYYAFPLFEYSTHPYSISRHKAISNVEHYQAVFERLTKNSPKTQGKAMVLALEDPVGIASDIESLMNYRHEDALIAHQMSIKDYERKQAISDAILALSNSVHINEANKWMPQYNQQIEDIVRGYRDRAYREQTQGRGYNLDTEEMDNALLEARARIEIELKEHTEKAWEPYTGFYKKGEVDGFRNQNKASLDAVNEKHIKALDKALVAWLESDTLHYYLDSCFDDLDINSGIVFASAVSGCLGASQDKMACGKLIRKYVDGKITDRRNHYLRALGLNLKPFIEGVAGYVEKLGTASFRIEDISEGSTPDKAEIVYRMLAAHEQALAPILNAINFRLIGSLQRDANIVLGALLNQGLGAIVAQRGANLKITMQHMRAIMGAYFARPVAVVSARTTAPGMLVLGEALAVSQVLPAANRGAAGGSTNVLPGNVNLNSQHNANAALAKHIFQLPAGNHQIEGMYIIDLEKIQRRFPTLRTDGSEFTGSTGGGLAQRQGAALRAGVVDPSQVDLLQWHQQQPTSARAVLSSVVMPNVTSTICGILNAYGVHMAYSEFVKVTRRMPANQRGLEVLRARMFACAVSFGASLAESAAVAIGTFGAEALRRGQAGRLATANRVVRWTSSRFGIAGAALMALCDAVEGRKAAADGQAGLAIVHLASAGAGLTLAYVLWYTTASPTAIAAAQAGTLMRVRIPLAGVAAPPWAVILFLVATISIIGFGVNKAKARAATQRWLGRCYYGNGYEGEKPYQNL